MTIHVNAKAAGGGLQADRGFGFGKFGYLNEVFFTRGRSLARLDTSSVTDGKPVDDVGIAYGADSNTFWIPWSSKGNDVADALVNFRLSDQNTLSRAQKTITSYTVRLPDTVLPNINDNYNFPRNDTDYIDRALNVKFALRRYSSFSDVTGTRVRELGAIRADSSLEAQSVGKSPEGLWDCIYFGEDYLGGDTITLGNRTVPQYAKYPSPYSTTSSSPLYDARFAYLARDGYQSGAHYSLFNEDYGFGLTNAENEAQWRSTINRNRFNLKFNKIVQVFGGGATGVCIVCEYQGTGLVWTKEEYAHNNLYYSASGRYRRRESRYAARVGRKFYYLFRFFSDKIKHNHSPIFLDSYPQRRSFQPYFVSIGDGPSTGSVVGGVGRQTYIYTFKLDFLPENLERGLLAPSFLPNRGRRTPQILYMGSSLDWDAIDFSALGACQVASSPKDGTYPYRYQYRLGGEEFVSDNDIVARRSIEQNLNANNFYANPVNAIKPGKIDITSEGVFFPGRYKTKGTSASRVAFSKGKQGFHFGNYFYVYQGSGVYRAWGYSSKDDKMIRFEDEDIVPKPGTSGFLNGKSAVRAPRGGDFIRQGSYWSLEKAQGGGIGLFEHTDTIRIAPAPENNPEEDIDEDEIEGVDDISEDIRVIKDYVESLTPNYVSFNKAELVKTFIQMKRDGTVNFNRGIFILASEEDEPQVDLGNGVTITPLEPHDHNFRLCVKPDDVVNPYIGIGQAPSPINIGTTFTRWGTIGKGGFSPVEYDPTASTQDFKELRERIIESPEEALSELAETNYSRYAYNENRPPHPLDAMFFAKVKDSVFSFQWYNYHNKNNFFEAKPKPKLFYTTNWMTYVLHGSNLIGESSRTRTAVRSKDLYATESNFKDYQYINDNYTDDLELYTLDKTLLPNVEYQGPAAELLRMMPSLRRQFSSAFPKGYTDGVKNWPSFSYRHSKTKGGAYYVTASYPEPDRGYYDISTRENITSYLGFIRAQYFTGYYHHDQYKTEFADTHLLPSVFVYACIKGAGLEPGFPQRGYPSGYNDLNNHRMQLIADTDTSYNDLVKRVLPGLGYVLRQNSANGTMDLVNLHVIPEDPFTFTSDEIMFKGVAYNTARQTSTIIFENDDMLRGDNTLEEFRVTTDENPEIDHREQGRLVIYNKNVFVLGKSITIKTGTWTSSFELVADQLSSRQDTYSWSCSNSVLIDDEGNLGGPTVGDYARLDSRLIPTQDKSAVVLITSKSQNESMTDFIGVRFSN